MVVLLPRNQKNNTCDKCALNGTDKLRRVRPSGTREFPQDA